MKMILYYLKSKENISHGKTIEKNRRGPGKKLSIKLTMKN